MAMIKIHHDFNIDYKCAVKIFLELHPNIFQMSYSMKSRKLEHNKLVFMFP